MNTQFPSRFSVSTDMYGNKTGNNQFHSEEDIRRELAALKLDEHEADIRIASLEVHYGKYVEAIGIQYEINGSAKGDKVFTILHGKLKAGLASHRIVLDKDEVLAGVDIWAGDIIDAVQFYVAKINESGIPKLTELKEIKKCGGAGGTKCSMKRNGTIIGFFGTAGAYGSNQVIHTLGTLFLAPKFKMPELPKMPSMPGMPKMPDMPGMPKMPDMPEMPKMPDMPGMPKTPDMLKK